MNILILSFYYYPDLCAGSFRCTALVEQLKELVGPDVEIEVITTIPNRYASFCVEAPEQELNSGIRIRRIQLPSHCSGMLDQAKAYIHFAKEVRRIVRTQKYTLVFATSSRLMTAVLGAWVAKKTSAKLYLDIRDIFLDTVSDVLPSMLTFCSKPFFSILEKWSFGRADHINVVSKGFEPYFASRYPEKSLSFFTNGIDRGFVQSPTNVVPFSGSIRVLYAGNIGEGQGLHFIIPPLAKQMQGRVHFKIIGDGGRRAQLEEALLSCGCTNVTIISPVSREQLVVEYHQADVLFLHLNDYDAFRKVLPSKLFEYAAVGKPVWAGVAGYPAEFITSEISNAVVFPPCDSMAAEKLFDHLILESHSRQDFIDKYSRKTIMSVMAENILSLASI